MRSEGSEDQRIRGSEGCVVVLCCVVLVLRCVGSCCVLLCCCVGVALQERLRRRTVKDALKEVRLERAFLIGEDGAAEEDIAPSGSNHLFGDGACCPKGEWS